MNRSTSVLMKIITSEVCQNPFDVTSFLNLSEEDQLELVEVAKQHSLLPAATQICAAELMGWPL